MIKPWVFEEEVDYLNFNLKRRICCSLLVWSIMFVTALVPEMFLLWQKSNLGDSTNVGEKGYLKTSILLQILMLICKAWLSNSRRLILIKIFQLKLWKTSSSLEGKYWFLPCLLSEPLLLIQLLDLWYHWTEDVVTAASTKKSLLY